MSESNTKKAAPPPPPDPNADGVKRGPSGMTDAAFQAKGARIGEPSGQENARRARRRPGRINPMTGHVLTCDCGICTTARGEAPAQRELAQPNTGKGKAKPYKAEKLPTDEKPAKK